MAETGARLTGLLAELREILQEERGVLLSGQPEPIARVVERKLQLAETIEREWAIAGAAHIDSETVRWLAQYNRGNSVICAAMLGHLTRTLDQLRRREQHRSYGPDGAENRPPAQHRLGAA